MEETETDIDILLECLTCQKKEFQGMKRSLLALATVFNSNGQAKEYFRKVGGLQLVHKLLFTELPDPVLQAAVFCLACAVENDVFCQNDLTKPEMFNFIHKVLKEKRKENKWLHAIVFLVMNLIAGNSTGQHLAKESAVVADLIDIFRWCGAKSQQNNGLCQDELELWSTVVTALSMCVNNPQNEVNQRLCSTVLPLCFQVVAENRWPSLCASLLSFAGLTVAGNGYNQNRIMKCGGLDTLLQLLEDRTKECESDPSVLQTMEGIVSVINTCITDNESNAKHFVHCGGVQTVMKLICQPVELATDILLQLVLFLGHALEYADKKTAALTPQQQTVVVRLLAETENEEVVRAIKYVLNMWQNLAGDVKEKVCQDYSDHLTSTSQRINQLSSKLEELDHNCLCQFVPTSAMDKRYANTRSQHLATLSGSPPSVLMSANVNVPAFDTKYSKFQILSQLPSSSLFTSVRQPAFLQVATLPPLPTVCASTTVHHPPPEMLSAPLSGHSSSWQGQSFGSSRMPGPSLTSVPPRLLTSCSHWGVSSSTPVSSGPQATLLSKKPGPLYPPELSSSVYAQPSLQTLSSSEVPTSQCLPHAQHSNISALPTSLPAPAAMSVPYVSQFQLPPVVASLPLNSALGPVSQTVSTTVTFPHLLPGPRYTMTAPPPQSLSQSGHGTLCVSSMEPHTHALPLPLVPPLYKRQDAQILPPQQTLTTDRMALGNSEEKQEWMAFQHLKKSMSEFLASSLHKTEEKTQVTAEEDCCFNEGTDRAQHGCCRNSMTTEPFPMLESCKDENIVSETPGNVNVYPSGSVKLVSFPAHHFDEYQYVAENETVSKIQHSHAADVPDSSLAVKLTDVTTNAPLTAASVHQFMAGLQTCSKSEPDQIGYDQNLLLSRHTSESLCYSVKEQVLQGGQPGLDPSTNTLKHVSCTEAVPLPLSEHSLRCKQERISPANGQKSCSHSVTDRECHLNDRNAFHDDAESVKNVKCISKSCLSNHKRFGQCCHFENESDPSCITVVEDCSHQPSCLPGHSDAIRKTRNNAKGGTAQENLVEEVKQDAVVSTSFETKTATQNDLSALCDASDSVHMMYRTWHDTMFRVPFPKQQAEDSTNSLKDADQLAVKELSGHEIGRLTTKSMTNQTVVKASLRKTPVKSPMPQQRHKDLTGTTETLLNKSGDVFVPVGVTDVLSEDNLVHHGNIQKTPLNTLCRTPEGRVSHLPSRCHSGRFCLKVEKSDYAVPCSPAPSEFDFQLLKVAAANSYHVEEHPNSVLRDPINVISYLESHQLGLNTTAEDIPRQTLGPIPTTLTPATQTKGSLSCHMVGLQSDGTQGLQCSGANGSETCQSLSSSDWVQGSGDIVPDSDISTGEAQNFAQDNGEAETVVFPKPYRSVEEDSDSSSNVDSSPVASSYMSEVYHILKDSHPSPISSVSNTVDERNLCPGCSCDTSLNSRNFNIAIETSTFTCQDHRRLRQIERDFIANRVCQLRLGKKLDYHLWKEQQQQQQQIEQETLEGNLNQDEPVKEKGELTRFDFQTSSSDSELLSPPQGVKSDTGRRPVLRKPGKKKRRKRVPYTEEEEYHLCEGVKQMGKCWQQILNTYTFHPSRTAVDLKDKYKQMQKQPRSREAAGQCKRSTLAMCEERRLRRGVARFGHNWKAILQSGRFAVGRTAEELRDRWRVIAKNTT